MAICPFDYRECGQAECVGKGCPRMHGEMQLVPCPRCEQLVGVDGSDPLGRCKCAMWDAIAEEINGAIAANAERRKSFVTHVCPRCVMTIQANAGVAIECWECKTICREAGRG